MITEIYTGPDACRKCEGWKQVANTDDAVSWKYYAELLPPSVTFATPLGSLFPIDCPRCQGSGREPSADDRSARIHAALAGLEHAWDKLSGCVDEFGTDAAEACAEYRDQLDTAILATLAAWKESR